MRSLRVPPRPVEYRQYSDASNSCQEFGGRKKVTLRRRGDRNSIGKTDRLREVFPSLPISQESGETGWNGSRRSCRHGASEGERENTCSPSGREPGFSKFDDPVIKPKITRSEREGSVEGGV